MSKANKRAALRLSRTAAAMALALTGLGASAEVSVDPASPALREPADLRAAYQIRCWQKGRLILDESGVALPSDLSSGAVKLQGRDRNRRPLYLVDTANATCVVKRAETASPSPGLPGSGGR